MSDDDISRLKAAYALETPDDNRRLYRDWAGDYDETFAAAYGYVYPQRIAALLDGLGVSGPVLDVGCGTGLVGEALAARPVDGLDISPEMLAAARAKGVYRNLIEADLTKAVALADGLYGGVISAGTFTHGHVGPEALDELVRVATPGAWFALGVNETVLEQMGFPAALARLADAGAITAARFEKGRIYAADAGHEKADNEFTAAIFQRL